MNSLKFFIYNFKESFYEIKNNSKIYFSFIALLALVSLSRRLIETYLPSDIYAIKIVSEILFSFIPIFIVSKILYIIKIRQNGFGEYKIVVLRYFIYNFCYFSITLLCLMFYLGIFYFVTLNHSLPFTIFSTLVCLLPLIYVMIYFSLSPIVAIFEDISFQEVFRQSQNITKKRTSLVLINHLVALALPISFLSLSLLKNQEITILISAFLAIPEALLTILIVLTTVRVYLYLSEID